MDTSKHSPAEELSAFLDGDLETTRRAEVASHLEGCADCRKVVEELRSLAAGLRTLAQVDPERDLWPRLRRTLEQRPDPSGWRRLWWIPAAAVAGAAAALLVVVFAVRSGGPGGPTGKARGPATALQAVVNAEIDYRNAIADLETALARERPAFSPEVEKTVHAGLAEIDATVERCRRALASDPKNLEAHETLLAAYGHKVDLLTDLVGASIEGR
jgi:anti-sigma factor RsiW